MADRFELGAAGDRPAVTIAGRTVSYAQLHPVMDRAVPAPGDLLDLTGKSVADTLAAVFAAARSGTTVLVRAPASARDPLGDIPRQTLLVAMTSGTSGRPRAVFRTAESWSASFRPLAELAGLTSGDTVLLTGPLHSTLHLFAAVHTLWLGAHLTDDPRYATAVHAVPTAIGDLLDDLPPALRTVIVAGAAVPPELESRAADRGVRLVEYYGAAELSFVAARVAPAPLRPFPGVEIRIVDGTLWARSPYLATGRLTPCGPEHVLRSPDGFATVGDRATIRADGSIVIRGRGDAAVTTGGHTVLAEDIEAAVAGIPGVRAVAVIGVPHARLGQVAAALVELTADGDLVDVRRSARQLLAGAALPRRWLVVERLPRTGNGKIARSELAAFPVATDQGRPDAPAASVR